MSPTALRHPKKSRISSYIVRTEAGLELSRYHGPCGKGRNRQEENYRRNTNSTLALKQINRRLHVSAKLSPKLHVSRLLRTRFALYRDVAETTCNWPDPLERAPVAYPDSLRREVYLFLGNGHRLSTAPIAASPFNRRLHTGKYRINSTGECLCGP